MKKIILISLSIVITIAIAYGSFVGYIYYKDNKRVSDIREAVANFDKKHKNVDKLDNLHIAILNKIEKPSPKKGHKLILIDVELISGIEENENFIEYNPNQFILKYDGNDKIAECIEKSKQQLLKKGKILGGQTVKGTLCFEIPNESNPFALEVFDDSIDDSNGAYFPLY